MKHIIFCGFFLLLFYSCNSENKQSLVHHANAKSALEKQDISGALKEIDLAITLDTVNLDFLVTKAKILVEAQNYEKALILLMNVAAKNYKSDTVNFEIGGCYFEHSTYYSVEESNQFLANEAREKALFYYNEALNVNPLYFEAMEEKIKTLHNLDRFEQAMSVVNSAITLFPDSMQLVCYRGVEKIYFGDYSSALVDLNHVIDSKRLESEVEATAYRFRAVVHQEQQHWDLAITDLTSAVNINPRDQYSFFDRAECYIEVRKFEEACSDLRKAADLGYLKAYDLIKENCTQN